MTNDQYDFDKHIWSSALRDSFSYVVSVVTLW